MDTVIWSQLSYLAITICVTVWVGHTLHKNGRVFLVDAFAGNGGLADSVNHLLVVGFYLINLGWVSVSLGGRPETMSDAIEATSGRIGVVLIVLGVMHFFNLFVFSRIRKRGLVRTEPPPVLPSEYLQPETARG